MPGLNSKILDWCYISLPTILLKELTMADSLDIGFLCFAINVRHILMWNLHRDKFVSDNLCLDEIQRYWIGVISLPTILLKELTITDSLDIGFLWFAINVRYILM